MRFQLFILAIVLVCAACQQKPERASLTVYCTSDVHGMIYGYDLKRDCPVQSSLANVSSCLNGAREQDADGVILLDNGDFLQGQPVDYYYNFIDTVSANLTARAMNALGYDAASVGNHDIEAGHPVFDRVRGGLHFPWLSANIVDSMGQPYFRPYVVLKRKGVKIAVLGMTTPGVPKWLPKHLWSGMTFEDMVVAARKWVGVIQKKENPDLLIGLFHSGFDYCYDGEDASTPCNENAGLLVAQQVDGFDAVILGHDHRAKQMEVTNDAGHRVVVLDPASHARVLGKLNIEMVLRGDRYEKNITSELVDLRQVAVDTDYMDRFAPAIDTVKRFIGAGIGQLDAPLYGRDGLFGPSAFTDLIHNAQLAVTGADVSLATVLQMDAKIEKGTVTVRDMFNLYSYENGLYVMRFTGSEIDRYLEYAFGLQYNTMRSPSDHLLRFRCDSTGQPARTRGGYALEAAFFNFSCAAGINYTVNVSRPAGDRVEIHSMSGGVPFSADSTYTVAINSYRANGGGGHLTQGVGWNKAEMESRVVKVMPMDVRYYLTEYIREAKTLAPRCRGDWQVVPEAWFKAGKERDMRLVYEGH